MTPEQLKEICPTIKNAEEWATVLTEELPKYGIDSVNRQAMFLAQCLHESGGFRYTKEIWGPTPFQIKYEGHKGLGNLSTGDGKKYMGRGLIQLTGKFNYEKFSDWVGDPEIIDNPSVVEQKKYATLSAIWFWTVNNLNQYADADNIEGCTKRVNGSKMLGLEERRMYYEKAKNIL